MILAAFGVWTVEVDIGASCSYLRGQLEGFWGNKDGGDGEERMAWRAVQGGRRSGGRGNKGGPGCSQVMVASCTFHCSGRKRGLGEEKCVRVPHSRKHLWRGHVERWGLGLVAGCG